MAQKRPHPDFQFPATMEGFGYHFDDQGRLRQKDTGEPFQFQVRPDDKEYNQAHYEALGLAIDQYVFELLEKRGGLKRVTVPKDAAEGQPQSFIFMSDDALTNEDTLMILIHGTGVVRAGQWARRVIMNDCIDQGTQLPYIEKAKEAGYGVIVLNTNLNEAPDEKGNLRPVAGSETPEKHGIYVWDNFVREAKARHVVIVAHSYGGIVTANLARQRFDEMQARVRAIAFTDSVHSPAMSSDIRNWMKPLCRNWVQSESQLDNPLTPDRDCSRVSAGTKEHVYTSPRALDSVFRFVHELLHPTTTTSSRRNNDGSLDNGSAGRETKIMPHGGKEGGPEGTQAENPTRSDEL